MENEKFFLLSIVCLILALCLVDPGSSMAELQKSYEYGNVVMDKETQKASMMPVVFPHWLHRAKHSCRLCHVDIEFAQERNETGVIEEDNKAGRYCGTCHNGKESFNVSECARCHPKDAKDLANANRHFKKEFFKLQKKLPRALSGNKIDWNIAEEQGLVTAKDYIEGITFPNKSQVLNNRDEPRSPSLPGLPDIIFSHSKHVAWTGCGMCHPNVFALETGKTKMTMKEISEGKFCGICHGKVAFPLNDCAKCHSKPVGN